MEASEIVSRAAQHHKIAVRDQQTQFQIEGVRVTDEFTKRNMLNSTSYIQEMAKLHCTELKIRAKLALDSLLKVMTSAKNYISSENVSEIKIYLHQTLQEEFSNLSNGNQTVRGVIPQFSEGSKIWNKSLNETLGHEIERIDIKLDDMLLANQSHAVIEKRAKGEKFQILDSSTLKDNDLLKANGVGVACIYLDIDDFKSLNTKFSERVVDKYILPNFQGFLAHSVKDIGFAYAEGGDEVIILLPNSTLKMAIGFIEGLQENIINQIYFVGEEKVQLKISVGIAYINEKGNKSDLIDKANLALREAKARGKNRAYIVTQESEQEIVW